MTVGLALPTPNGSSIPNPSLDNELLAVPMNSSYRAAWAVSAIDWCKWPMPQQLLGEGGGKMAIGSYIEDAANIIKILDTWAKLEVDPGHMDTMGAFPPRRDNLPISWRVPGTH